MNNQYSEEDIQLIEDTTMHCFGEVKGNEGNESAFRQAFLE